MRIICPSCQATYEVPETLLAGGKAARCARCGTEWMPLPAPPSAAALPRSPVPEVPPLPPGAEDAGEPADDDLRPGAPWPRSIDSLDDDRPPPRDDEIELAPAGRSVMIAWIVSLLVIAALIWAAFAFRNEVMGAWPPSARLYAAIGLR